MKATISGITALSPTIRKFTLAADSLPAAAPGAHIMVEIPGPARSWKNAYSLVSANGENYEIIVRRVEKSRGGSAWLHDHAALGDMLEISLPQNLFPLARTARKHLLLSAGIGITPFLFYLKIFTHAPLELHQLCKPEDAEIFQNLLAGTRAKTTIHSSRNALDLPALLAAQKLDTHLYLCGPESFMDNARATAAKLGWPAAKIHFETFGGPTGGAPFTAHLARSNITVNVGPEESLLEAIEAAGLTPPCLCRGGACGECEIPVLSGIPDHHDHFLSDAKRASNSAIMTCVSRAKTPELTLDF
jgi:ferredoxin-NADP reductase